MCLEMALKVSFAGALLSNTNIEMQLMCFVASIAIIFDFIFEIYLFAPVTAKLLKQVEAEKCASRQSIASSISKW